MTSPGTPGPTPPGTPGPTPPGTRRSTRAARSTPAHRWPRLIGVLAVVALVAATVVVALWVRGGVPGWESRDAPGTSGQSGTGTDPQSSPQSGAALDRVTVSGRPGATPAITVTAPLVVEGEKYREISAGSGRTIADATPVVLAITAFDGADGTILSPGARPRTTAGIVGSGDLDPLLDRAVTGRAEGSRLLFVRSIAAGQGESGEAGVEVDVVDILPTVADGEPVTPVADAPVTVTMGEGGPVLSHVAEAPAGEVTQLLLRGTGPQVRSGDRVLAQFSVTGWSDAEVRESTWDTGLPRVIDLSTAMPGLVEALVDQRVGSRVVVTIPPERATGDDTLIAVVDILGTSPADS